MYRAPELSQRLEQLITRLTLGVVVLLGLLAAVTLSLLTDAPTPEVRLARIAVPASLAFAGLCAMAAARLGHPRAGAAIAVAALLVGHRAGLVASGVAVATVVGLYWLDSMGHVFSAVPAGAAAASNILIIHCVTFSATGAVLSLFSKAFHQTLATADAQERRFRQLLEVAPLGYLLVRGGRVVLANRIAADFAGRTQPESLVGLAPAECAKGLWAGLPWLAVGEASPAVELQVADARGVLRRVEAQAHGVETAEGLAQLIVMRDVTDERAAARAMAEAHAQAEAANRAKGEFVANMSHEIRTPLNAIVGLSELACQPDLSAARRHDYLAKIGSASQSLLEIVSDILDVAKIEAGAVRLERIDFDPREELRAVLHLHSDRATGKGLTLESEVEQAVPAVLHGDPVRLRQVISNYLSNAVKFTPQGRVSVRMLCKSPGWLRVEVEDTGIGIDPATQGRLFQPFAQADTSTTRRFGGTGLGLALSRQLVELMGGTVGVDSLADRGSVFWAELPMPAGNAVAPQRRPADSPSPGGWSGQGRRILLVEDNPINRLVAEAVLERLGFEVVVAEDGQAAVDHFAGLDRADCDAVLMDLQMPVLDGCEAAAQLRRRFGADELPIIAMTAAALAENHERCLAVGMNDFIAKPFDLRLLEVVLMRWIGPSGATASKGLQTKRS